MKRLMLMAALCAAPLGCLSDQASGPFRVLNAYATTGSACEPEFSRVLSQGRLVWSASNNYGLFLNLEYAELLTLDPIILSFLLKTASKNTLGIFKIFDALTPAINIPVELVTLRLQIRNESKHFIRRLG